MRDLREFVVDDLLGLLGLLSGLFGDDDSYVSEVPVDRVRYTGVAKDEPKGILAAHTGKVLCVRGHVLGMQDVRRLTSSSA